MPSTKTGSILRSPLTPPIVPWLNLYEFTIRDWHENLDDVALHDTSDNRQLTFKQVLDAVTQISNDMVKLGGVRSGDFISVWCSNCIEMVLISLAAWKVGATIAMIAFSLTADEALGQIRKVQSAFVFVNPGAKEKLLNIPEVSNNQPLFYLGKYEFLRFGPTKNRPIAESCYPTLNDTALVLFSSGTTGFPKAVELTHINMVTALQMSSAQYTERRLPKFLNFLPMTHFYGFASVLKCLNDCSTTLIMPKFELEEYLRLISEHEVMSMALVPPVAVMLTKRPELFKKYDLSNVLVVFNSGAGMPTEVENAIRRHLPDTLLAVGHGYGLTESTGTITRTGDAEKGPPPQGSVGTVIPLLELKIVDLESGKTCCEHEKGEVVVRGPTVMKSYFDDPAATSQMIDSDGWMHTGDVGYYDENEFIFIVDRIKEIIKHKGQQVSPAELEEILLAHPEVNDAAVVGIPDEDAGEVAVAFVVRKITSRVTEKGFQDYVAEKVAPYKRLTGGVKFVSVIPKLPTGKILRRVLGDGIVRAKL